MEKSYPKMSHADAIKFWNIITQKERDGLNKLLAKMQRGEIKLDEVNVNKDNMIQNIVLSDRDKPSVSDKPFYKHFKD